MFLATSSTKPPSKKQKKRNTEKIVERSGSSRECNLLLVPSSDCFAQAHNPVVQGCAMERCNATLAKAPQKGVDQRLE